MYSQSDQLALRLKMVETLLPSELHHSEVLSIIEIALAEDLSAGASLGTSPADGDITSQATIPASDRLIGYLRAKANGVVAGLPIARGVFQVVDPNLVFRESAKDGDLVSNGQILAQAEGDVRSLLAGERTALNFLCHMSGIASLTRRFVEAVRGTRAIILDTRKTAPGHRRLEKYAVRMGGGHNHRLGLFDMLLIKDNHIRAVGGITPAVKLAQQAFGSQYLVEVEVKTLTELDEALHLGVNRILLDNMDLDTLRNAVQMTQGRVPLEASGNVTITNVRQIAETGVDFISSGALTHSAPVLDISMKLG
jgi:nicotinate-nucleotide pyrophosphorylase (carboxylating)